MLAATIILFLLAPAHIAAIVDGCQQSNNPGVFNEFGPLPDKLQDSWYFYRVVTLGRPFTSFEPKGSLTNYALEYSEFREQPGVGKGVYSYFKVLFKTDNQFKALDFIRVYHNKWDQVEDAIIEADYVPSTDNKLRVKYMLSNCECLMRVYDLSVNDIMGLAVSTSCDEAITFNNPHLISQQMRNFRYTEKIREMGPDDKFLTCDTWRNYGVFNEFGPLPSNLLDKDYFYPLHSVGYSINTFQLSGNLRRYKVEYAEFVEQYGIGSEVYGYHTLYYNHEGEYKILDYLRVSPQNWKRVQFAILEADFKATSDRQLRVKFLTSECKCVLRTYDLSYKKIAALATTRACNGDPIKTIPHTPISGTTKVTQVPDVGRFSSREIYPGCDMKHNFGVFDTFGPLPTNLKDIDLYYEVINTGYSNTKFQLWGDMENYVVEYSEFKEQMTLGQGVFAYVGLYFKDGANVKLIDYVRVDPRKWKQVQVAMLQADYKATNSKKLRVRYLTTDCTCVMRIYDLTAKDIVANAQTTACNGSKYTPSVKKENSAEKQLTEFRKATYKKWSHHYV